MEILQYVQHILLGIGKQPLDLTTWQVALRAIIMFVAVLVMVRLGGKRFLSHKTAFDAVLGFMIASMMARACNGSSPFWQTIAGGFVIIGMHRLMAQLALRHHHFGNLVKGHANVVIENGHVFRKVLEKHQLTDHDLYEDLRLNGNVGSLDEVKAAYFERNGEISVVKRTAS